MNAAPGQSQLLRLSALVELQRRVQTAPKAERAYLMVNDTFALAPYRQAALWQHGKLQAVSGVATPEPGAPYAQLLARILSEAEKQPEITEITPESLKIPTTDWSSFLPAHSLWLPLPDPRGGAQAGLLLAREEPWHPTEITLLALLATSYGTALALDDLPKRRRTRRHLRRRALQLALAAALLAAAFAPIQSSILAPADIVATAPFPIRAPFDGVVDSIRIRPNTPVKKGDLLLTLDTTERRARADVSQKALEIARAERAEAVQLGLADPRAKSRLAVLQGKLEQAELEADYDRTLLARAEIRAPEDGIAVFEDADQWIGHPVSLGERIMLLAPPASLTLDIAVPAADLLDVPPNADITFFPNPAPESPAKGHLTAQGYSPQPTPEGILAYTWRARLDSPAEGLRLGLKGTAKIHGPTRPFALWALRRPLATLRAWLPF